MTIRACGFVARINAQSESDVTVADWYDPSDEDTRTEVDSRTVHSIESSENGLTILLKMGLSGSVVRSTLIRIAKHINDKLLVQNEDSGESFTIAQVLNLSGGELSEVIAKTDLTIEITSEFTIPRHYLDKTRKIEFVETQSRLASRSGMHPKPIGKLINTGSKPSRQYGADHLPTVNELDRSEPEFQGTTLPPIQAGGYREQRDKHEDWHARHLSNIGADSMCEE
jgi:hypothetical protein